MEETIYYNGAEIQLRADPPTKINNLLEFEMSAFFVKDNEEHTVGYITMMIFPDGVHVDAIEMYYDDFENLPKGIGKYMMCYAFESLVAGGFITDQTEVSLEAEIGQRPFDGPLNEHPLILYYEQYGFELIEEDDAWMPKMETTVFKIRSFCNKKTTKRKLDSETEQHSSKRSRVSFGNKLNSDIRYLMRL